MTSTQTRWLIAVDEPSRDDIRALVQTHREWSLRQTPPEYSFSVEPGAVTESGITLFSARTPAGVLLGIGGLKELDRDHGEIKTMHTVTEARGRWVGRGLVDALLADAARRGYARVSLETGTGEPFRAARTLYESVGFRASEPFGGYDNTEWNLCMTLRLPAPPTG